MLIGPKVSMILNSVGDDIVINYAGFYYLLIFSMIALPPRLKISRLSAMTGCHRGPAQDGAGEAILKSA